jgi:hypothetical protein
MIFMELFAVQAWCAEEMFSINFPWQEDSSGSSALQWRSSLQQENRARTASLLVFSTHSRKPYGIHLIIELHRRVLRRWISAP